jgi:DNA-binding transcriptional MerR regulator
MGNDWRALLEEVKTAQRMGIPLEEINAAIAQDTEGRAADVTQLIQLMGQTPAPVQGGPATEPTQASPVSDFLRMAAQGASLEFGDELAGLGAGLVPGGLTREQAQEASRERVAQIRQERPVMALGAEMLGGLVTTAAPAGLLMRIGAGGVKGAQALRQLGSATRFTTSQQIGRLGAAATAQGAVEGGLAGVGMGTTGAERAERGLFGAAVGGGLGAVTGGVLGLGLGAFGAGGSAGRARRAGETVAEDLREMSGLRRTVPELQEEARTMRKGAQREIENVIETAPLANADELTDFVITNPEVLDVLGNSSVHRPYANELSEYRDALSTWVGGGRVGDPPTPPRPMTFREADDLRLELRQEHKRWKMDTDRPKGLPDIQRMAVLGNDFESLLKTNAPAEYTDALARYGEARGRYRLPQGTTQAKGVIADARRWIRSDTTTAEDIATNLSNLSPESANVAREAMAAELVTTLRRRLPDDPVIPAEAKKILEAGHEMQAKLRTMFPDDDSFADFMFLVGQERLSASMRGRLMALLQAATFFGGGSSVLARILSP